MEKFLTHLLVVAAAITRDDGKILLHRRPRGKDLSGLWEFPGGKVEEGEGLEEALSREIMEECGLAVAPESFDPVSFQAEQRSDANLILLLFHTGSATGEARPFEGGTWDWFDFEEASKLPLAPLDRSLMPQFAAWLQTKRS